MADPPPVLSLARTADSLQAAALDLELRLPSEPAAIWERPALCTRRGLLHDLLHDLNVPATG